MSIVDQDWFVSNYETQIRSGAVELKVNAEFDEEAKDSTIDRIKNISQESTISKDETKDLDVKRN